MPIEFFGSVGSTTGVAKADGNPVGYELGISVANEEGMLVGMLVGCAHRTLRVPKNSTNKTLNSITMIDSKVEKAPTF